MGLDIRFDRKKAIEAGAFIETRANATESEIKAFSRIYMASEPMDADYLQWMKGVTTYLHIPTMNEGIEVGMGISNMIVRANMGGDIYNALVAFLRKHDIGWEEF